MFFIFSKLLVNLIYPITWVFLLLLLAIVLKNPSLKRKSLLAAFTLLILFSNPFLLSLFSRAWDVNEQAEGQYSCAIVLGGFVSENREGDGYFNGASDRFIQAIKLKNTGTVGHILFTGGNASLTPGAFRESSWLKQETPKFNIPDSCVLIENQARNTLENVRFSQKMLKEKNLPGPYVLITSAFHMRRALLTCKKEGVNVVPYSCGFSANHGHLSFDNYFVPNVDTFSAWNIYIKELIGYVVYSLKN